jgi:uncharacterized membrane protein
VYLDWLRGLAVLIMILWHVVDSWTRPDVRDTRAFHAVIFTGGWAAPLFLFLAGVSVPLAIGARMWRGADRGAASAALQRRGWQVFLLAHLFRFQSFLLNPNARWDGLLKPDILNILGLGIVATAWLAGRAGPSLRAQLVWLLLPAAIVVGILTPLAPTWWWPTLLHPRLEAYVRPVGNYGVFSLFPAIAYVLLGGFLGARLSAGATPAARFHLRTALAGLAVVGAAWALGWPGLKPWAMWVSPVSAFATRAGTVIVMTALCWWAFRSRRPGVWSPVVLLGQTSLFVYWVHVELAYGVFSFAVRQRLTLAWSLVGYAGVTLLMYGLATRWARRSRGPWVPPHMAARPRRLPTLTPRDVPIESPRHPPNLFQLDAG